jgi:hypothetical protein
LAGSVTGSWGEVTCRGKAKTAACLYGIDVPEQVAGRLANLTGLDYHLMFDRLPIEPGSKQYGDLATLIETKIDVRKPLVSSVITLILVEPELGTIIKFGCIQNFLLEPELNRLKTDILIISSR